MMHHIGLFGAFLLSYCSIPLLVETVKNKSAAGINLIFLSMWLLGEILMLVYTLGAIGRDIPLLVNYGINTIIVTVIMSYKLRSKK